MARQKKYHIYLTEEESEKLKRMISDEGTSKTVRNRCQIMLDLDEAHGEVLTHQQSAKANGVCMATVMNIVRLYYREGIDGIIFLKRNENSDNARRKLDRRAEARLLELARGPAPEGSSRWTLKLLKDQARIELGISVGKNVIGRTLKKADLDLTKTADGAPGPKGTPDP